MKRISCAAYATTSQDRKGQVGIYTRLMPLTEQRTTYEQCTESSKMANNLLKALRNRRWRPSSIHGRSAVNSTPLCSDLCFYAYSQPRKHH